MNKTLKEVSELYNVIKVLKFNGVPADLRLRIIKLMRQLKPHAERLQSDVRDALERFKTDRYDDDEQAAANLIGKPLTEEQQLIFLRHNTDAKLMDKAAKDYLYGLFVNGKREGGVYSETVDVDIESFTESEITRIIEANAELDTESCVVLLELIGE